MFGSSYRKVFIGLVLCPALLSGCANMSAEQQQVWGGGIGCGLGVTACLLAGGNAAICAAACAGGAAIGWGAVKVSQYQDEKVRSVKQEQRMYGFTPTLDIAQVKIRKGTSNPDMVRPGESVKVAMDYSVTPPRNEKTTSVTESWELMKNGKKLTDLTMPNNNRSAGGWSANATIPIPKDAPSGTYVVKHKVQTGTSNDIDESTFVVSL